MAEMDRAQELIEKYFDEVLTPEETAELEALIRADPDVARRFSRLARTDSLIYSHFNKSRAEETVRLELQKEANALAGPPQPQSLLRPAARTAWSWRAFIEHLWGPSGAVLLHVLVIVLLVRYTFIETRSPPIPSVPIDFVDDDPPPFDNKPPDFNDAPTDVAPVMPPTVPGLAEDPGADATGDELAPGPEVAPVDVAGVIVDETRGPLILKDLKFGTRSGEGRSDALEKYNPQYWRETEAAVERALEWLKRKQAPDGSWGPNKVAMTGLALLTFLAHGETLSSEKYGATVEKAIRFLMQQQDEEGYFSRSAGSGGDSADATSYAHAIATYAISEAYGITRIQGLKPVMEKAVTVIVDGQQPGGGWNYRFSKSARRDTSVSGWMIQALKSALISGSENPGLRDALAKAVDDLKKAQDEQTGRFGYTERGNGSLGCTGIGVLSLQLIGHAADKETRQGMRALQGAKIEWKADTNGGWPLYEWYYITQAKFHHGGSGWQAWNTEFARAYTRKQNDDGSWPAASNSESSQGPVYSTTLAALTLQVYYRFLPTYQTIAVAPKDATSTNDVVVRVL